jgi:hypothetical protein
MSRPAEGQVLISECVHRLVEPCDAFTFGPSRTVTLEDFGPNHVLQPVIWDYTPRPTP